MRLIAYLRASDPRQGKKVTEGADRDAFGIEAQLLAVQVWAASNRHRVVQVCQDLITGSSDADVRPGLAEAIALIPEERVDGLVAARRDRFGRGLVVTALLTRLVEKAVQGWKGTSCRDVPVLFSADGVGNILDGADILFRAIIDGFAEYERWLIRTRTQGGKALAARTKGHHHGTLPFGYRQGAVPGVPALDPREAAVVRQIFQWAEEGVAPTALARRLNEAAEADVSWAPKKGGAWDHSSVSKILRRRRFYAGAELLTGATTDPGVRPAHPAVLEKR